MSNTHTPTHAPVPRAPVPSPCINVCRMNAHTGLCEGCLRTLDEIAAWGTLGEDDKRRVWLRVEQRQEAAIFGTGEPAP